MKQALHFSLGIAVVTSLVTSCSSMAVLTKDIRNKCESLPIYPEIVACYKVANANLITRKISASTRSLTSGDWPYNFQMIFHLKVNSKGEIQSVSKTHSSTSRNLDKKVYQSIGSIPQIYVPSAKLFDTGRFTDLKLLVKPARTPLLKEEQLLDKEALVIYLTARKR